MKYMPLEDITHIITHCSATPEGRDIDVTDIRCWHVNDNGWSDVGYHFVITLDGTVQQGRPIDKTGAHCRGMNSCSVGICLVGGTDYNGNPKVTYTLAQWDAWRSLVNHLKMILPRGVKNVGHYEIDPRKTCPNFRPSDFL